MAAADIQELLILGGVILVAIIFVLIALFATRCAGCNQIINHKRRHYSYEVDGKRETYCSSCNRHFFGGRRPRVKLR